MKKITILVCSHKRDMCTRNDETYKAIQLGKALHPDLNLGYLEDNDGDNISEKNYGWCELTGLYWGWKNLKDVEYAGLCHYRRYFDEEINEKTIDSLMKDKDIILVKGFLSTNRNRNSFSLQWAVSQEDYWLYVDTILKVHPECKNAFINYFYDYDRFYPYTMFISKKEIYDEFCEFIFPVFFELEKRLLRHGYNRQNRFIAYCGEWSLGLFAIYKKLRIKEIPLLFYNENKIVRNNRRIDVLRNLRTRFLLLVDKIVYKRRTVIRVPADVIVGLKSNNIDIKDHWEQG